MTCPQQLKDLIGLSARNAPAVSALSPCSKNAPAIAHQSSQTELTSAQERVTQRDDIKYAVLAKVRQAMTRMRSIWDNLCWSGENRVARRKFMNPLGPERIP